MSHLRRFQNTIARPARVSGFGFWSSRDVTLEFQPAEPNHGLVFARRDLPGEPTVPARVAHRREAQRRTVLTRGEASVEMVEHVLAALAGLHIDNCRIVVDAPEMPGLDGSSLPMVEALRNAGLMRQAVERSRLVVTQTVRVGDRASWIEARPASAGSAFRLHYELDYDEASPIRSQSRWYEHSPERFASELAPSRTFILKHEADWLRSQGLAMRATPREVLVFAPDGLIDNQLRFQDECVRHKMLDVIGDLALAGRDIVGEVHAYRSGHQLNARLVERLLEIERECRSWSAGGWSTSRRSA